MREKLQRVADTVRRLEAEPYVWIATASTDGQPHLVPLSIVWNGHSVLLAVPTKSVTATNVADTGKARLALDSAADVALIDADGEVIDFGKADADRVGAFVDRTGWSPEIDDPGVYSMLVLTPRRVLAWNGLDESRKGRTIMRDGTWLAD